MATNPDSLLAQITLNAGGNNPYNAMQLGNQQVQQNQQQLQAGALQLQAAHAQQQDQQAFHSAYNDYAATPIDQQPQKLAQMAVRFPQQAGAIKQSYSMMDDAQRQSQVQLFGQLRSAAASNRPDLVLQNLQQVRDAEKAKGVVDPQVEDAISQLASGDPAQQDTVLKGVSALANIHLAAADSDGKFSDNLKNLSESAQGVKGTVVGRAVGHYDANGQWVTDYRDPDPVTNALEVPVYDSEGKRIGTQLVPNGGKGGDPTSAGGAAGPRGDVSRLINTDAGGKYVPESVKTLGQFVGFGKALNNKGAKSSSAGTYQINGTTMAEFAPKAIGADWKQQPFNADTQEKVGEAIFNWAKTQHDPAKALAGRWVSLDRGTAAKLVQGSWSQARGVIAQGETGGAPGSSASAPAGAPGYIGPVPSAAGDASQIRVGDLSSVPDKIRATVQAIAEGRSAAPRPGTRFGEALLNAVTAYDPTFDAANSSSRVKTRVDFTSGKSAQTVNALNTAMGHLLHLDDQGHDLGNVSFMGGIINPARRFIQNNIVGNSEYKTFDQTKQAAASEMRKVFTGSSGGSLAELQGWEASLDSASSPEQLHSVIKNGVDLMGSRLSALKDQYATGMGRSDNVPQLIKPSVARQAKQRFGIDLGGGSAPAAKAPVRVTTPQQAMALPPGTVFITPDGRRKVR